MKPDNACPTEVTPAALRRFVGHVRDEEELDPMVLAHLLDRAITMLDQAAAHMEDLDERETIVHQQLIEVERAFNKYGHHLRGCKIRPDNAIMRALAPKGEPFVAVPCSCGFDAARGRS